MSGHLIHAVIKRPDNLAKLLPVLRRYRPRPMEDLRAALEEGSPALSLDWEEDGGWAEHGPKQQFRAALAELEAAGAGFRLYEEWDGEAEAISLEQLDNLLEQDKTIRSSLEREDSLARGEDGD